MPVVAVCPVHGSFESRHYAFLSGTGAELRGNSEPCPRCGRSSAVMEGSFDFDADGLATILSAPQWTVEALADIQGDLARLEALLRDEKLRDDTVDEWIDRTGELLSARDQRLAAVILAGVKHKPRATARAFLGKALTAVGALVTLRDGGEYTYEMVHQIVTTFFGR